MQPRISVDGSVVTLVWPTVPATVRMSKRDAELLARKLAEIFNLKGDNREIHTGN